MNDDYYISTTYLRLMMQSNELVAQVIKQGLGDRLPSVFEQDYVSGAHVTPLYSALIDAELESWAIQYGSQLGVGSHGALGFAVLSAVNLRRALEVLSEFLPIRISAYTAELRVDGRRASFVLHERPGHGRVLEWLVLAGLSVAQSLIETIISHPLGDNARLELKYDKPLNYDQLEHVFNIKCLYGCAETRLVLPASWLSIESPLYDEDTFRSNIAKCQELKLSLTQHIDEKALVKSSIATYFERTPSLNGLIPGLDDLAGQCAMSKRTLIRKLHKQGTSYRQIIDEVRLEQAKYLLKQTHMTIADIATQLSYQEPANFARAFKRLTGDSPVAWRRS